MTHDKRRFHFPRKKQGVASPWPVEAVHKYLTCDPDDKREEFGSDSLALPASFSAALVRHLLDLCDYDNFSTARSRVRHWYRRGLTDMEADVLAVSFGKHPVEIWPEWFDDVHV